MSDSLFFVPAPFGCSSLSGVAAAVGPLLGLFVFAATGNSWTPFSMKVVPLASFGHGVSFHAFGELTCQYSRIKFLAFLHKVLVDMI